MLAWSNFGLRLINPWQIVLVGKTNAGKSSLLNALLGYQRSLVDHAAGTTRDVLTAVTAVDGWPVELADTAGSRAAASALESEGISRAAQRVASADLVLVVSDVSTAWSEEDDRWVRIAPHAPIIVHNKCDLVAVGAARSSHRGRHERPHRGRAVGIARGGGQAIGAELSSTRHSSPLSRTPSTRTYPGAASARSRRR